MSQVIITIDEFRTRVSADQWLAATDPKMTGTPDTAPVQAAIDDATSRVLGAVKAGNYELPLGTIPGTLKKLVTNLALYQVLSDYGAGLTDTVKDRARDAERDCKLITARELMLDIAVKSAGGAPVIHSSGGPRLFPRTKTGGVL